LASVDQEDSFLTVAEVAELLKLNQQTVRNWIDQGSLPALRVGRRVRIKRSDLDRVLENAYSGGGGSGTGSGLGTTRAEPSATAEDFWGGDLIGVAERGPAAVAERGPAAVAERGPAADGTRSP
jgi:excisionase family DNA binding protein